jgi:dihydrolipoamide dehydrogenase
MYDLIVIGAGPGGYEAAAHAARMGKKVALIEKNSLGGTCLNVGCIPTKTLLKSVHVMSECRHAGEFGVSTADAKIDMAKVQERKSRIVRDLVSGVGTMLKKSGVEIIMAEAKLVASNAVEAGGQKYEAANILIATGATPAKPPIPGLDGPAVLDSTGMLQLAEIPDSLVMIGGGVIGLEFACFFAELGTQVTVLEMLPQIGMGLDREIAKRLQKALAKKGITFNLQCKVTRLEGNAVHYTDKKGAEQSVEGTYILNSTGRRPVVKGLGLEDVGVEVGRTGIVVDEKCKTNVDGIWACGDVIGGIQLAHVATREGICAVNNMFGRDDTMTYNAIPGVVYTHPEVAGAGMTEQQLKDAGVAYKEYSVPMGVASRFTIEYEGVLGVAKVYVAEGDKKILGVHMIGGPAGELITTVVTMLDKGMTLTDTERIVFPHPTISEVLRELLLQGVH